MQHFFLVTHGSKSWPWGIVSEVFKVPILRKAYLEAKLADLDTVQARLLGSSGGCEFDVVDTEGIESYRQRRLSNGHFAKAIRNVKYPWHCGNRC